MKITVISGTPVKGVTWNMKERFLEPFRGFHEIKEYITPIWNAILEADLIVFAYPVYALRAPGSVKALLDHFCVHWMVHRPEKEMFSKKAVILTNSVGAPNTAAQKDVMTSLTWMGVSGIRRLGIGLMEGVIWSELSEKRKSLIYKKVDALSRKYMRFEKETMRLKVKFYFALCKKMHEAGLKNSKEAFLDDLHYLNNGWIKDRRKQNAANY